MRLSELQSALENKESISFSLPNGKKVAEHFHVTEVGLITRHFIDCGGVERIEKKVNLQLWEASDYDHRLEAQKLRNILELSKNKLGLGDLEIEVEYQGETIGKYHLESSAEGFNLLSTKTACLAEDACGVKPKMALDLSSMTAQNSCEPGSGCC